MGGRGGLGATTLGLAYPSSRILTWINSWYISCSGFCSLEI